ncbi:MAG: response regulator [Pseudomonadota bacterium]
MLAFDDIQNAHILIVDDQKTNVELLQDMLKQAGYTRVSATMDPYQVRPLHREHCYDLILLDLQMPGLDGFQVLDQLKEVEADGYLPVLAITAQPVHKLRALQAGAKDFVSKPFDFVEVQTRIHNLLEVRLLYRQLDRANKELEQKVEQRTAELSASEARFRSFTALSSDWYWEQDAEGKFISVSGPAFEMLGISGEHALEGWNPEERARLDENIAARLPFLDFVYTRTDASGNTRYMMASGEPIFDAASRFVGYRGVGSEVSNRVRAGALPA